MSEVADALLAAGQQMSAWEGIAVVLAIAYLLLAMKESLWCWYCAFVSTAIYTVLFWEVSLLMESALNVFYMVMAVYGWWQWRRGGERHQGVAIHRWPLSTHAVLIGIVLLISVGSGYWLTENTRAVWPYVDAFTTWASVVTTWMVAKKVIENWLYWIVIDSVSVFLYLDRGMYLTALLFVAYVVIVIFGYFSWRQHEQCVDSRAA
ncbi:MAG: nicotinamide mononucleotide transporter [Porticoccaceae bacterium]|nr:nicotinamide mononucleotide transporter [Porticoccaceae bacterium]